MTRKIASSGGGREKKPAASMAKANKTQAGSKADSPRAVFGQRATAPRSANGEDKASRRRRDDSDWEIRKRQWKPSTCCRRHPPSWSAAVAKRLCAQYHHAGLGRHSLFRTAHAGHFHSPRAIFLRNHPSHQEFVVNVPTATLARATDYCGVKSGRDGDKFAGAGLTPMAAEKVAAPLIAECPITWNARSRKSGLKAHTISSCKSCWCRSRKTSPDKRANCALTSRPVGLRES